MAGFSYQHPPFLLETSANCLLNYTINKMSSASFDEAGNINNSISSSFPYSSSSPSHQSHNNNQDIPVYPDVLHCFDDNNQANCVTDQKHKADSSSMVIDLDCSDHQVTHEKKKAPHVETKRRSRDGFCSTSAQSKDSKIDDKAKKQKKCSHNLKEMEEKKIKKKTNEQPPNGYVHVRARRGEATDSHSLAERVRREKISKRLKLLQGLVPGCDKVASKALMLDEIINYVQSLQHQVEFLSMKLASLTPLFCDFGVNFHDLNTVKSEKLGNLESPLPTPSTTFAEITTTNNDSLQDGSISFLLQQGQMPNAFSQDNGVASWCLDDQRQRFTNQCGFTNLCSFQ